MTVESSRHTTLVLLAAGPLLELPAVAFAVAGSPAISTDLILGRTATQLIVITALLVTVTGIGITWNAERVPREIRIGASLLLWIAAIVVAVPMVGFLIGSTWLIFGILLAHSSWSIGMVASSLHQTARASK